MPNSGRSIEVGGGGTKCVLPEDVDARLSPRGQGWTSLSDCCTLHKLDDWACLWFNKHSGYTLGSSG